MPPKAGRWAAWRESGAIQCDTRTKKNPARPTAAKQVAATRRSGQEGRAEEEEAAAAALETPKGRQVHTDSSSNNRRRGVGAAWAGRSEGLWASSLLLLLRL